MLENASMIPGTREVRAALLTAVWQEPTLRALGLVEIPTRERVSRNTVIYRCRAGSTRLVAKAQLTKPPEVAAAEYRMLRKMEGSFEGEEVRALRPVALLEDLGVLVTHEEEGKNLKSLIGHGLGSSETAWKRARSSVEAVANALRLFHDSSVARVTTDHRASDEVRCNMHSTSNITVVRWSTPKDDEAKPNSSV